MTTKALREKGRANQGIEDVTLPSYSDDSHDAALLLSNPLRNMTVSRAVAMLEAAQRGHFADIQWAYRFIERRDEDIIALIDRRIGSITQLDWNINITDPKRSHVHKFAIDKKLAEEQRSLLAQSYNRIINLNEAIKHMALAVFRGFSIGQFQNDNGKTTPAYATHIECLNPWNIIRDGLEGEYYWNPTARMPLNTELNDYIRIDSEFCLIREWPRPLDEIALLKYIRSSLSRKSWDAFIEVYGIPAWVVIMPENVPPERENEYMHAASSIAGGMPGALPYGSNVKCADEPRGNSPFREHLQYLSEKLILAGTGGMLTMLSAAGAGTLAGSAHMKAFDIIKRGEAREINELFQTQFDTAILNAAFPGKPHLAYFELAAKEEQSVGKILDHAIQIAQAGGMVNWSEISEKTGYKITAPANSSKNGSVPTRLSNRLSDTSVRAENIIEEIRVPLMPYSSITPRQDKIIGPFAPIFPGQDEIRGPSGQLFNSASRKDEIRGPSVPLSNLTISQDQDSFPRLPLRSNRKPSL